MATIKDIAQIAGVSISTVSHVVNKTRYVSPQLEGQVQKAISELEQLPNFLIKKNKNNQPAQNRYVIFLKSEEDSYFGLHIERYIAKELQKLDYALITFNYTSQGSTAALGALLSSRPNGVGIIAFPSDKVESLFCLLEQYPLPTVLLSHPIGDFAADYISSDTEDGAYKAIRHLLRNGHEQIAFLSGAHSQNSCRFTGYCRALEEDAITPNNALCYIGLRSYEEVFSALNSLFEREIPPTAIFAATYSVAVPLHQYLNTHNIQCPKGISLVCFNDFEWAALHTPPITVVKHDLFGVAQSAVLRLVEKIERIEDEQSGNLAVKYNHHNLPTKLVVRSSTAGIAHGPFGERAGSIESLQLSEDESERVKKNKFTAAISFHYTGKAWMDLILKGILSVFKSLNISLIATTDAHFNADMQSRQLDSIRLLEPDVIISMPTDNIKTAAAFQKVSQSKSKLILITNVPDGLAPGDYVSCVSINEHSHGRNIGHGLGEYMLAHRMKNVALLKHASDFYATNQRDSAAEQILLEEYEQLNICGTASFTNEDEVYNAVAALIRKHPETEALYTPWEGPAIEAMRALNDLGRNYIAIATGDLDYNTALVLARGGMIKAISAQCPYEQGKAIALSAANALLGKATPSFLAIEPVSVTPDSLLKVWKNIYKEDPPAEFRESLKANANYYPDIKL